MGLRQTSTATAAARMRAVSANGTGISGSISTRTPASGSTVLTMRSARADRQCPDAEDEHRQRDGEREGRPWLVQRTVAGQDVDLHLDAGGERPGGGEVAEAVQWPLEHPNATKGSCSRRAIEGDLAAPAWLSRPRVAGRPGIIRGLGLPNPAMPEPSRTPGLASS